MDMSSPGIVYQSEKGSFENSQQRVFAIMASSNIAVPAPVSASAMPVGGMMGDGQGLFRVNKWLRDEAWLPFFLCSEGLLSKLLLTMYLS